MKDQQRKNAHDKYNKYTSNASEKDIQKINAKIEGMNKGKLKEIWDKVMLLWKLIKDPNAAWTSKAIAIGALLYAISPIDAIPDFIPGLGLTDDAAIILAAIGSLGMALNKYDK